jgi:uncharacterized protein YcbK (DUF882 family)
MERGAPLFPEPPKRHRIHGGLQTERQEHLFTWMAVIFVLLYATAWVAAIQQIQTIRNTPVAVTGGEHEEPAASPQTPGETIATTIFGPPVPLATTTLTDAMLGFLHPLRGRSGELRYVPALPDSRVVQDFRAPREPGIYPLTIDLSVVTLVPRSKKRRGRVGMYQLGDWPFESGGKPRTPRYAAPAGFIEVTRGNQDFHASEHFRLRQFLTNDQRSVWPKYLVLDPFLIDKLELTIQELRNEGVRVEHVHVMSGFRTPRYNAGGGNTAGRANLSRHMYGDGADVYVDNDRDGSPDDITGDGRVTTADAEKFAHAAAQVEKKHRSLIGGIGIYPACCGHGPFTHVDVRGVRARWRGSGNG